MTYKSYTSQLPYWDLLYKKVILRADLNVPMHHDMLLDDAKLRALQPTLDYLIHQQASVLIVTHLGRPTSVDTHVSTKHLLAWFAQHNYHVLFASTPQAVQALRDKTLSPMLILLENIRFFPEEKSQDLSFAQTLKALGDFYVHDGFAVMHTRDTSSTLLATLFDPSRKTIGFAVEKELNTLDAIVHSIQKPLVVIVGGAKLNTKIAYIQEFLDLADAIIMCPALAFTFLKAQGLPVGTSSTDTSCLEVASNILTEAKKRKIPCILPCDLQVEYKPSQYAIVASDKIPPNARGISIGPRTIQQIEPWIQEAKTIIYNGAIGFLEQPETLVGMKEILTKIAFSSAQTIVAGGDTTAVVRQLHLSNAYTYLSSGGGVTLSYAIHKTLPALQSLY